MLQKRKNVFYMYDINQHPELKGIRKPVFCYTTSSPSNHDYRKNKILPQQPDCLRKMFDQLAIGCYPV